MHRYPGCWYTVPYSPPPQWLKWYAYEACAGSKPDGDLFTLPLKDVNLLQIGKDYISLSLEKGGDVLIRKHWKIRLTKSLQRLDVGELGGDKFRKNHTKGRKGERERERENDNMQTLHRQLSTSSF